ncbi:MAG: universal stress protein, partial [Halovenus sp.]
VGARAFAISGMTGDVERLLVSLSGDVAVENILAFVEELVGDRDIEVTLFVAGAEEPDAEQHLEKSAERLRDAGITVETDIATAGSTFDALLNAAPGHDTIVMGERAPSLKSFLFGDEPSKVASASVGPVLVVRSETGSAE